MNKGLKGVLWIVGVLAVIALAGRMLLFETWVVPEDSFVGTAAAPTLRAGDFLLVLTVGEAGFGELVRCPDPEDPSAWVIGRITGVGGDEVEVVGRAVRVNGTRYGSGDACTSPTFEVTHPETGRNMVMSCSRVDMGGGWHYRGNAPKARKGNDHKKRVGPEKVYLLSDNRDMHDDSRDFGTLPAESCHQRLFFRLWGAAGWTDSEARMTFIR